MRRELYPTFIPEPVVGGVVQTTLCQDCANIHAHLKAQKPGLGDFYLSTDDIRAAIVDVQPNLDHDRDFAIAARQAVNNNSLYQAILAYNEHYHVALAARAIYLIGRKDHLSDAEARALAAIWVEKEIKLIGSSLDPFIDWLIAEADRLDVRANGGS